MAIDHSMCDHEKTPRGRAACRARMDATGTVLSSRRPRPVARGGPQPDPKPRQRAPQPREWAPVDVRGWLAIRPGTDVLVHASDGHKHTGRLVAPIRTDGYATVDLGEGRTATGKRGWLGVRHIPYGDIKKIFVYQVAS